MIVTEEKYIKHRLKRLKSNHMNLNTFVLAQARALAILVSLLNGGLIFAANAATEAVSFDLKACRSEAKTTLDYNGCASRAQEQSELLLNQYLEKAYEQDWGEGTKKRILQSQQAWETYKAAHCSAVDGNWSGSISTMIYHECRTRVTKARTLEIWESFLYGIGGSGYSALPKPVFDSQ